MSTPAAPPQAATVATSSPVNLTNEGISTPTTPKVGTVPTRTNKPYGDAPLHQGVQFGVFQINPRGANSPASETVAAAADDVRNTSSSSLDDATTAVNNANSVANNTIDGDSSSSATAETPLTNSSDSPSNLGGGKLNGGNTTTNTTAKSGQHRGAAYASSPSGAGAVGGGRHGNANTGNGFGGSGARSAWGGRGGGARDWSNAHAAMMMGYDHHYGHGFNGFQYNAEYNGYSRGGAFYPINAPSSASKETSSKGAAKEATSDTALPLTTTTVGTAPTRGYNSSMNPEKAGSAKVSPSTSPAMRTVKAAPIPISPSSVSSSHTNTNGYSSASATGQPSHNNSKGTANTITTTTAGQTRNPQSAFAGAAYNNTTTTTNASAAAPKSGGLMATEANPSAYAQQHANMSTARGRGRGGRGLGLGRGGGGGYSSSPIQHFDEYHTNYQNYYPYGGGGGFGGEGPRQYRGGGGGGGRGAAAAAQYAPWGATDDFGYGHGNAFFANNAAPNKKPTKSTQLLATTAPYAYSGTGVAGAFSKPAAPAHKASSAKATDAAAAKSIEGDQNTAATTTTTPSPSSAKSTVAATVPASSTSTTAAAAPLRPATAVVRIRGLPYTVTREEIEEFLKGYPLDTTMEGGNSREGAILLITKGGSRGEGYAVFKDPETAEKALHSLHKCTIGERYVELYVSSKEEMETARTHQDAVIANQNPIIRVRGLPFTATVEELRAFFDNVPKEEIIDLSLCYSNDGKLTGDAFVEFASKEGLVEAKKKHNSQLGSRYLEIIDSNQHEKEVILHAARGKKSALIQQQRRTNKAAAAAAAQASAEGRDPVAAAAAVLTAASAKAMAFANGHGNVSVVGSRGGRGGRGAGAAPYEAAYPSHHNPYYHGGGGPHSAMPSVAVDPYAMVMAQMMSAAVASGSIPHPSTTSHKGVRGGHANAFTAMVEQMASVMASPQMLAMMGMAAGAAMANTSYMYGGGHSPNPNATVGDRYGAHSYSAGAPRGRGAAGGRGGRGAGGRGRGGYEAINEDDKRPAASSAALLPIPSEVLLSASADAQMKKEEEKKKVSEEKPKRPINPLTGKESMFDVPWDAPVDSCQESESNHNELVAAVAAAKPKPAATSSLVAPIAVAVAEENADKAKEEEERERERKEAAAAAVKAAAAKQSKAERRQQQLAFNAMANASSAPHQRAQHGGHHPYPHHQGGGGGAVAAHPPQNFPAFNPMLMAMMNPMLMAMFAGGGAPTAPHPHPHGPMGPMGVFPPQPRVPSRWAVRVRGLPYKCDETAVGVFFSDVSIAPQGVHLAYSENERFTGEAYVEVMSREDMEKALRYNGRTMGKRYIEVFASSGEDIVRLGGALSM